MFRLNLFALIALLVCAPAALHAEGSGSFLHSEECAMQVQHTRDRVAKDDSIRIDRGLSLYIENFPELESFLYRAGDRHWVDLGAGQGLAGLDAVRDRRYPKGMRVTLVGAGRPHDLFSLDLPFPQYPRYIRGYLENVISQIEPADFVTDFFGPAHYVTDLVSTVEQSLSLVRPGGTYVLSTAESTVIRTDRSQVVGNHMKEWAEQIEGTRLIAYQNVGRLALQRTEGPIKVPELELIKYRDNAPPERAYLLRRAVP